MAGAGLAAVLSFFSVAAAQQPGKDKHASSEIKTVRIQRKVVPGNSALSGTVLDPMEATMPAVAITLINEATKARLIATTNENGEYVFPKLAPGQYSLIFKAAGFKQRRVKGVLVGNSEQITVTTTLDLERYSTVGVIVTMDEFESSQGTLTLRDSFMKRLPM